MLSLTLPPAFIYVFLPFFCVFLFPSPFCFASVFLLFSVFCSLLCIPCGIDGSLKFTSASTLADTPDICYHNFSIFVSICGCNLFSYHTPPSAPPPPPPHAMRHNWKQVEASTCLDYCQLSFATVGRRRCRSTPVRSRSRSRSA